MAKLENQPIFARRGLLLGAAATLFCAPSIVRASSLMVLRGVPLLREQLEGYGFLERLYVDSFSRGFIRLQAEGLSANEIAARMNSKGRSGINRQPWDGGRVIGLLVHKDKIARADAVRRRERKLSG